MDTVRRLLIVLAFVTVAAKAYAAPQGWTCEADFFGDGGCDCGCGVLDSDCADNAFGTCEFNSCPIDGQVPKHADPTKCVVNACGDGVIAVDEDCDDGNAQGGDGCSATCTQENGFACDSDTDFLSRCSATEPAPPGWTCETDFYGDGSCDCGCGVDDLASDCPGGASVDTCFDDCETGTVDPNDTTRCVADSGEGEGEGEGEGDVGEGEGEGDAGEGEGEGEGTAPPIGEGEGEGTSSGEGEGDVGEGEGAAGEGEGEGEGAAVGCASAAGSSSGAEGAVIVLGCALLVTRRRR